MDDNDGAYKLRLLAISLVHDAMVNITKRNKYADQSRLFLQEYRHTWCAAALDIEPELIARGARLIAAGELELGSLVMKKEFVHHPLEGLYAKDVAGAREYSQW